MTSIAVGTDKGQITRKKIKAVVVRSALYTKVGWGGNNSFNILERLICNDCGGYITEDSLEKYLNKTEELLSSESSTVYKSQFDEFIVFLEKI